MVVPDPPDGATLPHDVLTDLAVGQDWLGSWWPAGVLTVGGAVLVAFGGVGPPSSVRCSPCCSPPGPR
jgi:hypothetical protein